MRKLVPALILIAVLAAGGWVGYCWWVNQQVISQMDAFAQSLRNDTATSTTLTYQTKPNYFKPGNVAISAITVTHTSNGTIKHTKITSPGPVALNADIIANTLTLSGQNLPVTLETLESTGPKSASGQFSSISINLTPSETAGQHNISLQSQGLQLANPSSTIAIGPMEFLSTYKGNLASLKATAANIEIRLTSASTPNINNLTANAPIPVPMLEATPDTVTVKGLELNITPFDDTLPEQDVILAQINGFSMAEGPKPLYTMEKATFTAHGSIANQLITQSIKLEAGPWITPSNSNPAGKSLACSLGLTMPLEKFKSYMASTNGNSFATNHSEILKHLQISTATFNFGPCQIQSPDINAHLNIIADVNNSTITNVSGTVHAQGTLVEGLSMMAASIPGAIDPSATDTLNLTLSSAEGSLVINGQPMFPLPQFIPASPDGLTSPTSLPTAPESAFMPMDTPLPTPASPTMQEIAPAPMTETITAPTSSSAITDAMPDAMPDATPEPAPQPAKKKPAPKPKKPEGDRYLVEGIEDKSTR